MNPAQDKKIADEVWNKVLALLESQLSHVTITTWFGDVIPIRLDPNVFVISTSNPLAKDIIDSRYANNVCEALKDLFSSDFTLTVLPPGEGEVETKNPRSTIYETFTFDRFIVGEDNKFAHANALAVAKKPDAEFNPLFIYGNSGLGKTHLLHAIANGVQANFPEKRVLYATGESWLNEVIHAIQTKSTAEFRDKYRSIDLFLMDDVQFFAGKETAQTELFHTFNTLYNDRKQIVFTSDRPPGELLNIDIRLTSRFFSGLPVEIKPPDYETRMAIIKSKCERKGIILPQVILELLAEHITVNVRMIEGTINKLLAVRDLNEQDLNDESILRVVKEVIAERSDIVPTAEVIIEEVCSYFNMTPEVMCGQARVKKIATARHIAIYLIRNMTNLSLVEVGNYFSGRDHTTILSSVKTIEKKSSEDPKIESLIRDIRSNINNRFEA